MKKTVTLNQEQQLYVIPEGSGYSCLGFAVCEKWAGALGAELAAMGEPVPPAAERGTLERHSQYCDLCAKAAALNTRTGWRSSSQLTPQLIGLEGKRVEVRHRWKPDGAVEVRRFYVGKSTGYIPCHLEVLKRNSSGGCAVCLGEILSVRVLPNPSRR